MMQRYQSRSPGSMQQRNHKASEVKRGKAFSLELLSPVPDSAAAESTSNVCLDNLHRHKSVKHGSSTNYEVHQPCTYSDVYDLCTLRAGEPQLATRRAHPSVRLPTSP